MTTQQLALNIENRVNELLNKYDLYLSVGNREGALKAVGEIEELMDELRGNTIMIETPKSNLLH